MELLLLEDSRSAQTVFASLVDQANAELHSHLKCVGTMAEARPLLEKADVIAVDLSLPDSDPQKTMDFVRDICIEKPVIVYSATQDEAIIEECGRLGVGFITKACFSCTQVDRLVAEIVRARGALKAKQEENKRKEERGRLLTESAKALGCNVQ